VKDKVVPVLKLVPQHEDVSLIIFVGF